MVIDQVEKYHQNIVTYHYIFALKDTEDILRDFLRRRLRLPNNCQIR